MDNKLKIFENREFGKVRVQEINGQPYFVGKDVAKILGYERGRKAVYDHVDEEDRNEVPIQDAIGRLQKTIVINESGLYSLILSSKLPRAKEFKRWVTSEILPTIRKHGAYLTPDKVEEVLLNPDTIINLATELKKERLLNEQNQKLIGELKPKADYTDMILQSKGTVTINAIANDYGMTAIAMNRLLYSLGVQYKQGEQWLLYGKYRNFGYTHNKTIHYHHKNGTPATKLNMEWTQKGRLFLYRLLKEHDILPLIEELSA